MKHSVNAIFFSCLVLATGLFSMDLYNPALPAIVHALSTSQALIRNIVIAFLIGLAISQLFYGKISTYYGRKPILLIGLSLCILGNILSALSHNGWFLLFSRFITGLGVGAFPVMARAILRDSFSSKIQLTKAFSLFSMTSTSSPAFAPMLGGFISHYFPWQATFIFLSVLSALITFLVWLGFQETAIKKEDTEDASVQNQTGIKCYIVILKNTQFLSYTLMSSFVFTISIGYYTISPFVYQEGLGISSARNGLFYIIYALGILFGANITNKLVNFYEPERVLLCGVVVMLFVSILMVFLNVFGYFSLYTVIIPTFILATSCGLISPILTSLSLLPFQSLIGVAGGIQGTLKMLASALTLILFAFLHIKTQLPMSLFFLILTLLIASLNIVKHKK